MRHTNPRITQAARRGRRILAFTAIVAAAVGAAGCAEDWHTVVSDTDPTSTREPGGNPGQCNLSVSKPTINPRSGGGYNVNATSSMLCTNPVDSKRLVLTLYAADSGQPWQQVDEQNHTTSNSSQPGLLDGVATTSTYNANKRFKVEAMSFFHYEGHWYKTEIAELEYYYWVSWLFGGSDHSISQTAERRATTSALTTASDTQFDNLWTGLSLADRDGLINDTDDPNYARWASRVTDVADYYWASWKYGGADHLVTTNLELLSARVALGSLNGAARDRLWAAFSPGDQYRINDTTAPTLDFGGGVYEHREQPSDHRDEGLYEANYGLAMAAADTGTGVSSVELKIDGAAVPSGTHVPSCSGTVGCSANFWWNLATDSYADGQHTFTVTARDGAGLSTAKSFAAVIDRQGSIVHAVLTDDQQHTGEDSGGQEWLRLGTHQSRFVDIDTIWTQSPVACSTDGAGCLQRREVAGLEPDNLDGGRFTTQTGTTHDDARLLANPDLEARYDANIGPVVSTGAILTAVRQWLRLPPTHGASYELHETSTTDTDVDGNPTIDRVWLDSATKLPLRRESVQAGDVLDRIYYKYDTGRLTSGQVPWDFFSAQESLLGSIPHTTSEGGMSSAPPAAEIFTTHAQEVGYAIGFRQEFGFDADPLATETRVSDAEAHPEAWASSVATVGTPLTNGEMANWSHRQAIQNASSQYLERLAAEHSAIFAGGHIDQQDEGKLRIGFVQGTSQTVIAGLVAEFEFPDDVVVFSAEKSLEDLTTIAESIEAERDTAFPAPSVLEMGDVAVSVRNDSVSVGITAMSAGRPPTPGEMTSAQAVLSAHATTEVTPEVPQELKARWRGGAGMWPILATDKSTYGCTAGFGAKWRGNTYVMTAAHCGLATWAWSVDDLDENHFRGYARGSIPLSGGTVLADAGLIRVPRRYRSSQVAVTTDSNKRVTYRVYDQTLPLSEESGLCAFGANTNRVRCGVVVDTDSHQTATVRGTTFTVKRLLKVRMPCAGTRSTFIPGDSGGPAYQVQQSEKYINVVGIITSGDNVCEDGRSYIKFTQIGRAIHAVGKVELVYV